MEEKKDANMDAGGQMNLLQHHRLEGVPWNGSLLWGGGYLFFSGQAKNLTSGVLLDLLTFCGGRIYDTGFKTA